MEKSTMILAEGVEYSLNCHETKLNNNVLIVGTSGSGKTRSIVKPNIFKATGSYVISDPKGNLYDESRSYLISQGYRVMKLDFTNPEFSERYNPFRYIRSTQDILKMGHMLMFEPHPGNADPFWEHAGEILIQALIAYLWEFRPAREQNLEHVMKLMRACEIEENDPETQNALDRIMDDAGKKNPGSFAVKQYKKFRCAAGRTLKSILISVYSKIAAYDVPEIAELTSADNINISTIGDAKTALFVVVSDTDRSLDPLANLFFSQAMNELCYHADKDCINESLPVPVRFIMDDFATNCCIDDFPRMIASIRSRNISTMLMIQAEAQLKNYYGFNDKTIIGNCDTYVYLGGNDVDTAMEVAKRVDVPMTEILTMPVGTSWIFRRGQKPINCENVDYDKFIMEIRKSKVDRTKLHPVA